jgi:signal transduction histidine kinase
MSERPARSRRLLILFAATTVIPVASLLLVGWRLMEADRREQIARAEEIRASARDQAANLAVSALQRVLAEAEQQLTEFNASPAKPVALNAGTALIAFERDGVIARSGSALPWYPAIAESFTSADRRVRSEAVLRQAHTRWLHGDASGALAAYNDLATLNDARTVDGLPAGLAARLGRAYIFENAKRQGDLRREAQALERDLADGRWPLARKEFEGVLFSVREWILGEQRLAIDLERAALAEVAEELWRAWNTGTSRLERDRTLHRVGDQSILALTRASDRRMTALLIAPGYLQSVWLKEAGDGNTLSGIRFALTDATGPVLGHIDGPTSRQTIRPQSATVPWTLYAIDRGTPSSSPTMSRTTRLLLIGIAMMIALVLAVAYFIHRTMVRELTIAQLQSDFVAAVSHEFRTPLTTMRQLSEMLVRGRFSSEARRQEFYETLLRESDRLQKLVEGVLDFKRFEAGGAAYRFETIEAARFVREVVSEFERRLAPQGFRVELAAADGDMPVVADRDALTRAIWNLLDNAAKYSPECRTIWVDVCRDADRVSIAVRDQGLGIPVHQQAAIFERFVRGEQSKALGIKGTGIGLAMVKTIVQAHGGEIRLASEPGQGSRFTLLLRGAEGLS